MRAVAPSGLVIAVLLAACGGGLEHLPAACSDGPGAIVRALAAAPGAVRLAGGTRLSECVTGAYQDGEVQQLGFSLTPAADALARRATPRAALQLGYLLGAVRRGAARTNGVHLELVRRLESTVTFDDPALLAELRRGDRAGEAGG